MKVSILVVFIVLPMLASIGLYCYSFISTRWGSIDKDLIDQYSSKTREGEQLQATDNLQLERQYIRHAFRSRYGLFGYCLDYKWLYLFNTKSEGNGKPNSTLFCERCDQTTRQCPETGCCMKRCNNIPDCPSYIDEIGCNREYDQTRYYWRKENCIWQSTWIDTRNLSRDLAPYSNSPRDFYSYTKRIRYYIMFLLFAAAPLFTLMGLFILFCINCIERFYSIPFAFVSLFSFTSFLSGAGGLGLFLYEWIQERLHRPEFTYEFDQAEALIVAFNPWIIDAEQLGLAFWITVAAIGTSLFTTILSCCFCCGLQSDRSKLRIHVKDEKKYQIVQMSPYDE